MTGDASQLDLFAAPPPPPAPGPAVAAGADRPPSQDLGGPADGRADAPAPPGVGDPDARTPEPVAPPPTADSGLFGDLPVPEVETPYQSIYVHFERPADVEALGKLLGFPLTMKTRALRWPPDDLFPDRSPSALAAVEPEEES